MNNWADIPEHLLELITEKGFGFEDILSLELVCKQWRAAAAVCKETFMKKQTQQLPWLMLPPKKKRSHLRGFYSLSRRRIYQIPSSEFVEKKCYSSRGWLLTVGSDLDMDLLHPLTLARFNLPGIKSFSDWRSGNPALLQLRFIHRMTLSASPSLLSNFVLMVIQGCPAMPAYWRPGDKIWTLIEATDVTFADAVFLENKCYFITFWGKLLVTYFETSYPTTAQLVTEFSKDLIEGDFFEELYLVNLEGSLLLVSREGSQCYRPEKEFKEKPYQTINFQVFKLDFESMDWEELRSLGKWSPVLGRNSSMALDASVVQGCKPNSIYFTGDNSYFSFGTRKGPGFNIGIFNMADKKIEPIIEGEWRSRVSPPLFVLPTF